MTESSGPAAPPPPPNPRRRRLAFVAGGAVFVAAVLATVVVVALAGSPVPRRFEAVPAPTTTTSTPAVDTTAGPATPLAPDVRVAVTPMWDGPDTEAAITSAIEALLAGLYGRDTPDIGDVASADVAAGVAEGPEPFSPAGVDDAVFLEPAVGEGASGVMRGTPLAYVVVKLAGEAGDDAYAATLDVYLEETTEGWEVVGLAGTRTIGDDVQIGRVAPPDPAYVLVIGTDARWAEDPLVSRGDSLHILALDLVSGTGSITGIARDSYVETPAGNNRKITEILSTQGVDALFEAAGDACPVPLEGYILTGFKGFSLLVDSVGGLDVLIPYAMSDSASGAFFDAGLIEVLGEAALAFARNRHLPGGDLARSYHQGQLMLAGLATAREIADTPEGLFALLGALDTHTTSSLTPARVLLLVGLGLSIDPDDIQNVVLPGELGSAGAASVVFTDFSPCSQLQSDGVYETPPAPPEGALAP